MSTHRPDAVRGTFFSAGTWILLGFMTVGYAFGLGRFLSGLGAVTNLDDAYPWGIWIAIDVACGVALAAGGFTTAALVDIFGRRRFLPLLRPALLTAWLGYILVGIALMFDLGRYWNIWRPTVNWQGNSVLFEVGMCVMAYLFVLTVEMSVPFLEGLESRAQRVGRAATLIRRLARAISFVRRGTRAVLPLFILAGVVLSSMHQSSLGSLMVIAPTKMSPLWYSPLLPALFLMSAVMVGFPMVILESIVVSRSLGRDSEMDVLTPLARIVPWTIGIYMAMKLGDLLVRGAFESLFARPGEGIALLVEIVIGLLLPFVLLLVPAVRHSAGWLFFASVLVIGGVVINRINTFITAYRPPFADGSYFPSIGEIALTGAIVCTIMFLYRVMVFVFPILPGMGRGAGERNVQPAPDPLPPGWGWFIRGTGAAALVGFALLYATVHRQAVEHDEVFPWARHFTPAIVEPLPEGPPQHASRPEGYKKVYRMNSPLLNERTNFYEPARFTHLAHDVATGGNCAVCHHRFSLDPADRVGYDVRAFHLEMMEERIAGPCAACHEMKDITIQRCATCHLNPAERDWPDRLGLKGAYHRQCIGCHEDINLVAPTECKACHHPLTPDHSALLDLRPPVGPTEVTARCLECHQGVGEDVRASAHWNWRGHSPGVAGHEHSVELGLGTLVNNHLFSVGPNREYCASCHIGVGAGGVSNDIDCLVCHDTTGEYRKALGSGGAPDPSVDLIAVAERVGRPSRARCGSCHFYSDGAPNLKHGDLAPTLADPQGTSDVHMGRYDLLCQDCHETSAHRIAGRSLTAPADEGRVECERCHGSAPHGISGVLGRHLDDHIRALACETCHIPYVAKDEATRLFVDYRRAAEIGPVAAGALGTPVYPPDSGVERWARNVVPQYLWYDGTREAYVLGDPIQPSRPVILNRPLGQKTDPQARVYPFKLHEAEQPYDAERRVLVVAELWGGFWRHADWERAVRDGMAESGLEYSGKLGFVRTRLYTGIHHEVVPSEGALGCADCHEAQAVACTRCHSSADGMELPSHAGSIYPAETSRLDFDALGYEDDPARIGGRFFLAPGRGVPIR